MQKVAGQLLSSSVSRDVQGYDGSFMRHALYQRRFAYGNYSNAAMGYPISLVSIVSPFVLIFGHCFNILRTFKCYSFYILDLRIQF
ncbi:hypothetical protein GQ457_03G009250 [Hibiscus cannabinus]